MSQKLSEVHGKVVKNIRSAWMCLLLDYIAVTLNLEFASPGIIWTSPVPCSHRHFALALSL